MELVEKFNELFFLQLRKKYIAFALGRVFFFARTPKLDAANLSLAETADEAVVCA